MHNSSYHICYFDLPSFDGFFWRRKIQRVPSKNKVADENVQIWTSFLSSATLSLEGSVPDFFFSKKIVKWKQVKITTIICHRLQILPRFGRDPMPFWSYYYLYSWIPKMKRLLPHQTGRNQRLRLMPIKRKGTKEGKIFMSMYVFITCFHESWIFYLILSFWCNCYLYKVI